jgi:hypothetical protein
MRGMPRADLRRHGVGESPHGAAGIASFAEGVSSGVNPATKVRHQSNGRSVRAGKRGADLVRVQLDLKRRLVARHVAEGVVPEKSRAIREPRTPVA